MLVHRRHACALKSAHIILSRILLVKFNSCPALAIISVLPPTEDASEEAKTEFYQEFKDFIYRFLCRICN